MTRPAISAAATAILGALPSGNSFPTIGIITSISAVTVTGVLVTRMELTVQLSDRDEEVDAMWGGGLAAEISLAMSSGNSYITFIGRQVKVELIDGLLFASYTVNGSVDGGITT